MEQPTITITPIRPTMQFTIPIDKLFESAQELHTLFVEINKDAAASKGTADEFDEIPFRDTLAYADQVQNHYSGAVGVELDYTTCHVLAWLMYAIDQRAS